MPVGSYYPSRNCPICRERLWYEERLSKSTAWQYYNAHIHTVHPDFEKWNKRMSLSYLSAVPLLFGSPAVALVIGASTFMVAPFVVAGFLWVLVVLVAVQIGKLRFRKRWSRDRSDAQASSPRVIPP